MQAIGKRANEEPPHTPKLSAHRRRADRQKVGPVWVSAARRVDFGIVDAADSPPETQDGRHSASQIFFFFFGEEMKLRRNHNIPSQ